jgi:hypothetical protein
VEPHELDASGVNGDGTFYVLCVCGWRSRPCESAAASSVELRDHINAETPPRVEDRRNRGG